MIHKIAIHSAPRSGSTWLGNIFDSHPEVIYKYQPLFSYRFKGRLDEKSTSKDINDFFSEIAITEDEFMDQVKRKESGQLPLFEKNKEKKAIVYKEVRYHHIIPNLLRNTDIKMVGLVRNPFAVIDSWLRAPKEFRKDLGWNEMEEWQYAPKKNLQKTEEFNGYEKWKEVFKMFLKLESEYPENFILVNYSDLLKDSEKQVKKIFDFCGLDLPKQTTEFLQQSRSNDTSEDAYSIYRNKTDDGQWKKNLNGQIVKYIQDDLIHSGLNRYFL